MNTIRLAPPLVITKEELDWAVDQIEAVLGLTSPHCGLRDVALAPGGAPDGDGRASSRT